MKKERGLGYGKEGLLYVGGLKARNWFSLSVCYLVTLVVVAALGAREVPIRRNNSS